MRKVLDQIKNPLEELREGDWCILQDTGGDSHYLVEVNTPSELVEIRMDSQEPKMWYLDDASGEWVGGDLPAEQEDIQSGIELFGPFEIPWGQIG